MDGVDKQLPIASNGVKEVAQTVVLTTHLEAVSEVTVKIGEKTTVEDVKSDVELQLGIPADIFNIEMEDITLSEDSIVLSELGISEESIFKLKVNPLWERFLAACLRLDNDEVKARIRFNVQELMSREDKLFVASFIASRKSNSEFLFGILVEKKLDIKRKTRLSGRNLLHMAVTGGSANCIANILMNGGGALIDMEDIYGKTPLSLALMNNCSRDIIRILSGYRMLRLRKTRAKVDANERSKTLKVRRSQTLEEDKKNSLGLDLYCDNFRPHLQLSIDSSQRMMQIQTSSGLKDLENLSLSNSDYLECETSRKERDVSEIRTNLEDNRTTTDSGSLDYKERSKDVIDNDLERSVEDHKDLSIIGNSPEQDGSPSSRINLHSLNFNENNVSECSPTHLESQRRDICFPNENTSEHFNEDPANNFEKGIMKQLEDGSLSNTGNGCLRRSDKIICRRSSEDVSKTDDEGFGTEVHSSCDSTIFYEDEGNIVVQEEMAGCQDQVSTEDRGAPHQTLASLSVAGAMLDGNKCEPEVNLGKESNQTVAKFELEKEEHKTQTEKEKKTNERMNCFPHPTHIDNDAGTEMSSVNRSLLYKEQRTDTGKQGNFGTTEKPRELKENPNFGDAVINGEFSDKDIPCVMSKSAHEKREESVAKHVTEKQGEACKVMTEENEMEEKRDDSLVNSEMVPKDPNYRDAPKDNKIENSKEDISEALAIPGAMKMNGRKTKSLSFDDCALCTSDSSSAPTSLRSEGSSLVRRRESNPLKSRTKVRSLSITSVSSLGIPGQESDKPNGSVFIEDIKRLEFSSEEASQYKDGDQKSEGALPRIRKNGVYSSLHTKGTPSESKEHGCEVCKSGAEGAIIPRPPKGSPNYRRSSRTRRNLSLGSNVTDKEKVMESLNRRNSAGSNKEMPKASGQSHSTPPRRRSSGPRYVYQEGAWRRNIVNSNLHVTERSPHTSLRPRSRSSPAFPDNLSLEAPQSRSSALSHSYGEESWDQSKKYPHAQRTRKVSFDENNNTKDSMAHISPRSRVHSEVNKKLMTFDEWLIEKAHQTAKENLEKGASTGAKTPPCKFSKSISFEQWLGQKLVEKPRKVSHPGHDETQAAVRYQDPSPYKTWLQKKDEEALDRERKLLEAAIARSENVRRRREDDLKRVLRKLSRDERVRRSSFHF